MDRKERTKQRDDERREQLDAIRREAGCIDCGTTDGLLHFDHRDPATKLFTIGDHIGYRWETILAEVAKCDVRCAACHAKRHGSTPPGAYAIHIRWHVNRGLTNPHCMYCT